MDKIKVLLTGGSGTLGTEILKLYDKEKYIFFAPSSSELNIIDYVTCLEWFSIYRPNLVIHSAAYTDVKDSEENFLRALNCNILGTVNILKCCERYNIKMVYISTDYVFDGDKGNYSIQDPINPITKYAKSKAAGELATRMYDNSLVVRTSFFKKQFPYEKACVDQYSSKDYIDILAQKILNSCLSDKLGIVHIGSTKRTIYEIAKIRNPNVKPIFRNDLKNKIPKDTSLECE